MKIKLIMCSLLLTFFSSYIISKNISNIASPQYILVENAQEELLPYCDLEWPS